VPDNRGILGALRNQNPAVWKIHSRNSAVFLDYLVLVLALVVTVVVVVYINGIVKFP
jgi:hypothetical protein